MSGRFTLKAFETSFQLGRRCLCPKKQLLEGRIGRNEKPIGDAGFRNCCANVRLGLGCLTLVHGSARTLGRRFLFLFFRSHDSGAVTGALTPKPIWALYLGAIAGQLSYQVLFLKVGPLFPLGALFLVGYCLVFLAAAALVGYIRIRLQDIVSFQPYSMTVPIHRITGSDIHQDSAQ